MSHRITHLLLNFVCPIRLQGAFHGAPSFVARELKFMTTEERVTPAVCRDCGEELPDVETRFP